MRYRFAYLLVALALAGASVAAERNLVPNLGGTPDICSDRPQEPAWMQTIGVRDAYKRVLVQDIYRAQNMERIVASASCTCDIRFPAWDGAEAEFRERFAPAERSEMLEASDTYNRRANALRSEAMKICEAAGNW